MFFELARSKNKLLLYLVGKLDYCDEIADTETETHPGLCFDMSRSCAGEIEGKSMSCRDCKMRCQHQPCEAHSKDEVVPFS